MIFRQRICLVVPLLAVVIFGVCLIQFFRQRTARALGSGLRIEEAVAFKFGQLIRENLPGTGPVLVVQFPPANAGAGTRTQRQLDALRRGLGTSSKSVLVVSPQELSPAACSVLAWKIYDGTWGQELLSWVTPYPNPRAIVSFMGFPEDLPAELPQPWPPLLAVYAGRKRSPSKWIERGIAFALAELRPDAALGVDPSTHATVDEVFNANFTLVMRHCDKPTSIVATTKPR